MLTDAAIRKAKPRDKDYKLADSGGLYLFVTKAGHRSWRLKYRFADKEKRLVLGSYPDLSLVEARDMRDDAKRMLRDGRDPVIEPLTNVHATITDTSTGLSESERIHLDGTLRLQWPK